MFRIDGVLDVFLWYFRQKDTEKWGGKRFSELFIASHSFMKEKRVAIKTEAPH